ncbi:MAG: IS1380 family transposase [Nitrospinae bacterium]|nr:IS1380 family transposase [Nitrospinota bacterium]
MNKIIKNMSKKQPNVKVVATGKGLTINAGLLPTFRFLDRLDFKDRIESYTKVKRGVNALYTFSDSVVSVVAGFIAGANTLEKVEVIGSDETLHKVTHSVPCGDSTTLGRIFRLAKAETVHGLESVVSHFRGRVWKSAMRSGIKLKSACSVMWVDVDSTVVGVCGNPEGADKGYNPSKHGQKSYHPLLAFVSETKEVLHSWLRCGSAYSANGVTAFMRECMARVNKRVRVVLRGDSAFFVEELMNYLDSANAGYLIKVKLRNLEGLLSSKTWLPAEDMKGWESTEFQHKCGSWKKERRFVALRKVKRVDRGLIDVPVYEYFCYVTTEGGSPLKIHRTYGKRATCETWIEEFKGQLKGCSIRTSDFWANSALFQCAILAYNVMKWMALLTSSTIKTWEVKSMRFWLVRMAGKLLTGSGRLVLTLPERFLYRKEWFEWEKMSRNVTL